jgi:hypothetical protein
MSAGALKTMESMPGGARERLAELRNGLLNLHRTLVRSEGAVYDREVQKIRSSYQMLGLLMNDPWFGWLHELSLLVVEIDEALEEREKPVTAADGERFLRRAKALVAPAEFGEGFQRRYFEALQRDPDVILAHRQFRQVLKAA